MRRRHVCVEIPMDIPITPAQAKRFRYALRAAVHNAIGDVTLVSPAMGFRWQTKRKGSRPWTTWMLLWALVNAEGLVDGFPSAILESSLHEAPKGLLELHFRTETK